MAKLWTKKEIAYLRKNYGRRTPQQIAERLGRTRPAVLKKAVNLGVARRYKPLPADWPDKLREFHALGYTDAEIGRKLDTDRHFVTEQRAAMGLACNALSEWRRRQVGAKTREQCEAAGVKSLAEVRVQAFRAFARRRGWPEDLRPRAVQILDVLYEQGPMTRRKIAEEIGMPWKGSRKSLLSNDPEGSYLAHLIARGFVVVVKRANRVTGQGRGKSTDVYSIPPTIKRGDPHTWPNKTRRSGSRKSAGRKCRKSSRTRRSCAR